LRAISIYGRNGDRFHIRIGPDHLTFHKAKVPQRGVYDNEYYNDKIEATIIEKESKYIGQCGVTPHGIYPHGYGTLTYQDSMKYEGNWESYDELYGWARITYSDGTQYEGEWDEYSVPQFDAEHPIIKECNRCTNNVTKLPQVMYGECNGSDDEEDEGFYMDNHYCKFCARNCKDLREGDRHLLAGWDFNAKQKCVCRCFSSSTKKQRVQ
jgi:hypothetical protein